MQQDSKQIIKGLPRRIALMLLDCGLIVLCYWLAVMLRFDSGDAYKRVLTIRAMAPMLAYVLPIYMIVFWFGGLYEIMWEYAGMRDLARLTCLSGPGHRHHHAVRPVLSQPPHFRRCADLWCGVQHGGHSGCALPMAVQQDAARRLC